MTASPSPATAPGATMQAVVHREYGGPETMTVEEVPVPQPAADQVQIRLHAAAVNPLDWYHMTGTPYIARPDFGLRRPKHQIRGVDLAGTVTAVGSAVTEFKVGDEVFGSAVEAFAQYVVAGEDEVVHKPEAVSFEQAAAAPVAAITALQALRDKGRVSADHKVLIIGASGGVGTFAVQIAKSLGAEVTGVCSTRNVDLVTSLGADRVIDYTTDDLVARSPGGYDFVMDNVCDRSLAEVRRVTKPDGTYVMVAGNKARWLGPIPRMVRGILLSLVVRQNLVAMLADETKEDLAILADLLDSGKMTSVIDRRFPLSEVPQALDHQGQGRARGKIVITF